MRQSLLWLVTICFKASHVYHRGSREGEKMLQTTGHPWLHFWNCSFLISGTLEDVCYTCRCRVEGKWNAFIFCCSSPQAAPWPQGTVGQQEGLGWEVEVGRGPEEVPDQRVGEAGDKRAAEVGIKIPCDKWPQCLSRASCLHLQAATQALLNPLCHWHGETTDAWSQSPLPLSV